MGESRVPPTRRASPRASSPPASPAAMVASACRDHSIDAELDVVGEGMELVGLIERDRISGS